MDRTTVAGHDVRLVIVVNGPDPSAVDRVRSMSAAAGLAATIVFEPERDIPFARNSAVRTAIAQGAEAVAFIDDDDIPHPDWLGELIAVASRTGADLVLGRWRPPADLELPPILQGVRFFKAPDPEATNRYGLPAWGGSFNMLIRTSLIKRLADAEGRLFDPAYLSTGGSDTDLFVRAARAGGIVQAAPRSTVVRRWEPERISLRRVMRRAFRLGVTQAMVGSRYWDQRQNRRRLRRGLSDMVTAVAGFFGVRSKAGLGAQLVRIAEISCEIHCALGVRARYYVSGNGP